jgi:anti-sigma factor RsiW
MWLWLSGELPENERRHWQRHVQSCPRCQELLATADAVQDQYRRLQQYGARERVIRTLTRQAQASLRAGWLSRFQTSFSTLASLLDFHMI